jgi:predicted regulator of Ras-like GTPase activity (Roadblock/LC7/MglB family)
MNTPLHELLTRIRGLDGVDLAAVVANDGLLIDSSARPGVEVEAICAVASNALVMADALGREISKGGSVQTVLEYERGLVVLEPVNADAMLLVVTSTREQLGRLRYVVAKHRAALQHAIGAI